MIEIKGNNKVIKKGIVVAGMQSLENFSNKQKERKYAWLPKIVLCDSSELSPVEIKENGIFVENPSGIYVLQFGIGEGPKEETSKFSYKFGDAFIVVNGRDGAKDIWVSEKKINHSHGYSEKHGISYSKDNHRITVLNGSKKDLTKMISLTTRRFPDRIDNSMYDHYRATDGNRKSSLKMNKEDIEEFSRTLVKSLI